MSIKKEYKTLTELFIDYGCNHIIDYYMDVNALIKFADTNYGNDTNKKDEYIQIMLYIFHNTDKFNATPFQLPNRIGINGLALSDIIPRSRIESISEFISTTYTPGHYDQILSTMESSYKSRLIMKVGTLSDTDFVRQFVKLSAEIFSVECFINEYDMSVLCLIFGINKVLNYISKIPADKRDVFYSRLLVTIVDSKKLRHKKSIVKLLIDKILFYDISFGGDNVTDMIYAFLDVGWFDLILHFRKNYKHPIDKRMLGALPKFYPHQEKLIRCYLNKCVPKEMFNKFVDDDKYCYDNLRIFKIFKSVTDETIHYSDASSKISYYDVLTDVNQGVYSVEDVNFDNNDILYILHRRNKIKLSGLMIETNLLKYKSLLKIMSTFINDGMTRSILYYM